MIADALVEQRLRQSLSLRRSRPDIASIGADRGARQLHADDLFELVRDAALIEASVPSHEHRLTQINVVHLSIYGLSLVARSVSMSNMVIFGIVSPIASKD